MTVGAGFGGADFRGVKDLGFGLSVDDPDISPFDDGTTGSVGAGGVLPMGVSRGSGGDRELFGDVSGFSTNGEWALPEIQ